MYAGEVPLQRPYLPLGLGFPRVCGGGSQGRHANNGLAPFPPCMRGRFGRVYREGSTLIVLSLYAGEVPPRSFINRERSFLVCGGGSKNLESRIREPLSQRYLDTFVVLDEVSKIRSRA